MPEKILTYIVTTVAIRYNTYVVAPNLATERGVGVSILISFLVSVAASIIGYYVCKWLDGDDSDN